MGDDEVSREPVHDGGGGEDCGLHLLAHAAGVGLEHHEYRLAGGLALGQGLVEVSMVLQRRVARGSRIVAVPPEESVSVEPSIGGMRPEMLCSGAPKRPGMR